MCNLLRTIGKFDSVRLNTSTATNSFPFSACVPEYTSNTAANVSTCQNRSSVSAGNKYDHNIPAKTPQQSDRMRLDTKLHAIACGRACPPAATSSNEVTASTASASPSEASTSSVTFTSRRRLTCCKTGRIIELLTQPSTAPTSSAAIHSKCIAKWHTQPTATPAIRKLTVAKKNPPPK